MNDFDNNIECYNKVSDLVSIYLFQGKAPMELSDEDCKLHARCVREILNVIIDDWDNYYVK